MRSYGPHHPTREARERDPVTQLQRHRAGHRGFQLSAGKKQPDNTAAAAADPSRYLSRTRPLAVQTLHASPLCDIQMVTTTTCAAGVRCFRPWRVKLLQQDAGLACCEGKKKSNRRTPPQQQQSMSRRSRAFDHDALSRSKYFARAPSVVSRW